MTVDEQGRISKEDLDTIFYMQDLSDKIRKKLTPEAKLMQIVEECNELSQAAIKYIRVINAENPPRSMTIYDAYDRMQEEVSDLFVALDVFGISPDPEIMKRKIDRWNKALEAMEENKHDAD